MVANLTYRTAGVWGGGLGTNLTAGQVDENFFTLFSAIQALEDHVDTTAGIDFINQPAGGNLFYIHLTNHAVLGPFTIPTSQWNPRDAWEPTTAYAPFDVVQNAGNLYLVDIAHTSAATFSPNATDGMGHNLYSLLLSSPANSLPTGGAVHQRLVKSATGDFQTAWANDYIRLALFIEGQPNPGELLMQFVVTDAMTLPLGLVGTSIFSGTPTQSNVTYSIGYIPVATGIPSTIGTITFTGPSPEGVSVAFASAVSFVPGDVITLTAPGTPDAAQANISITLLATLN